MLNADNKINSQIKDFIEFTVGRDLQVYNASTIITAPSKPNRIEFKLDNFQSLGFNQRKDIETQNELKIGVSSMYDCVLEIRVIDTPLSAMAKMTRIIGGLNHSDLRNAYLCFLSIKPHTIRQTNYEVKQDGDIYRIERLLVDVSLSLYEEFELDWFNKIENVELHINGVVSDKWTSIYEEQNDNTWEDVFNQKEGIVDKEVIN